MKSMASFAFLMVLVLSLAGCFSGKLTHSNPLPAERAANFYCQSTEEGYCMEKDGCWYW